jgi:putative redox protein
MSGRTERVTFPGTQGELSARLDLPAGTPAAYALFAHCFTCSKDFLASARISRALAERGLGVLRFDFTGLGSSQGEFASTNFSSNVGDIRAAAAFLRARHRAPALLVGHSLGGAAVLAAAVHVPEARAVATIGAPADPEHVRHLFADATPEIEARGEAAVVLAGRPFRIRRQFLEDIAEQRMQEAIRGLGKALLVFHAPGDLVVSVDNARRLFDAARHPKSFVSLDDADHLLTRPADAEYVASVLAAWASRYVGGEPVAPTPGEPLPAGTVEVAEAGLGRFAQVVSVGAHRLRADEPLAAGGDDSGPSPYEWLVAALGACTSMTVRMYAERKGWPLEQVRVRLRHRKDHARDCQDCEAQGARLDHVEREVDLRGALDDVQRQRLLEIANRCPVHRTLEAGVTVQTRLAGSPVSG